MVADAPASTEAGLISPPLTARTPIISLSGYLLIMTCRRCGERVMPVDHSAARLMADPNTPPLISSTAAGAAPLGKVMAKVHCGTCGAKPIRLEASCLWIKAIRPGAVLGRLDLTALARRY